MKRMTKEQLVEVRCCCDVGKILGYLPHRGRKIEFFIIDLWFNDAICESTVPSEPDCNQRVITLEYEHFYVGNTIGEAYKSKDYDIEDLRQIPGWRNAE